MNEQRHEDHLADTVMTSLGILAIAVTSAVEVVLFLHRFGTTSATDGVFAAFALYTVATVFAQILRTSAVPLVTGDAAIIRPSDFSAAVAGVGALVCLLCVAGSWPLASVVAGSVDQASVDSARSSLLLLGPAMGLQILGAGMAVIGARRSRLRVVGLAYILANIGGLIGFLVLAPVVGEQSLAWCVLISSLLLIPCLVPATGRRLVRPGTLHGPVRSSVLLVRSGAVPLTFVALYPITLALAGEVPVGAITRFALAYSVCSYLPGLTSIAVSMGDVARLAVDADRTARARVAVRSVRWSSLIVGPMIGIGVALATPALALFEGSGVDAAGIGRLFVLLCPWLAATIILWATLPTLLAETRGAGLLRLVPVIIGCHVAATLTGRWLAGFDGVILAMAVAPLGFALESLRRTGVSGEAPRMARDLAVVAGFVVIAFAPPAYLAGLRWGSSLAASAIGVIAGAAVYVILVRVAFPNEFDRARRIWVSEVPTV